MIQLRDYQEQLISEGMHRFSNGARRVLLQLPTGGGKGRILPRLARMLHDRSLSVIAVAHRAELIDQIANALDDEDMQYGRIQPGWPMLRLSVQVGMVQTVARRLSRLRAPDFILVDEAHHMPAGQYQAMCAEWPHARLIGLTATPVRTDRSGLDEFFDELVLGPTTRDLISRGFLADYQYFMPSPDFDAAGIGTQMGDYKTRDALKAMEKAKIVGDAVGHYRQHLLGRPAIAFCMGVEHTHSVAKQFSEAGFRSAGIDGKMDMTLRRARLKALANGQLDVLTAADVVSEGVDIPHVAGAILLRPTCSLSLFLQQVGRALRVKPDGSKAVILDHVGNAKRHGLPADPRGWTLKGPSESATNLRTCKRCLRVFDKDAARDVAEAECERVGSSDDPCPIMAPAAAAGAGMRSVGEVVEGLLEAVTDPWEWAGGIDPIRASGPEWRALLAKADTEHKLKQIAVARGYRHGWVRRILLERGEIAPNAWERQQRWNGEGATA